MIDTLKPSSLVKYDYVYDKNDTKTIAGYLCYKVTCTITNLEDDETMDIVLYISDDFIPNYTSPEFEGLKGYPFYIKQGIDNESGKYDIVVNVTEVTPSKKIKNVHFLLPEKALPISEAPAQIKQYFNID